MRVIEIAAFGGPEVLRLAASQAGDIMAVDVGLSSDGGLKAGLPSRTLCVQRNQLGRDA